MAQGTRGFSLTETLIVVGLLAILVIVAAPRLGVPEPIQVGIPARQLAADLRHAQRLAIARREDYLLEFSPVTPPFQSYVVRAASGLVEPDYPKPVAGEITVTGQPSFRFRPDGSSQAGGTVTLTAGGATSSVQVISSTGRVLVSGP